MNGGELGKVLVSVKLETLRKEQLPISFRSHSRNRDDETLASFTRQSTQQSKGGKEEQREKKNQVSCASFELVSKPKVDHKGVKKKQQIMFEKASPVVNRNI